jgi:alginate O-acetyltransferase complex protein AlgJ
MAIRIMQTPKPVTIAHETTLDSPSDDELRQGQIPTAISRSVAWTMIGLFLVLLAGVPVLQLAVELARGETPQVLDLFTRTPVRKNLKDWEDNLEKVSVVKSFFQPVLQEALCTMGGFGNTNVVVGRDCWLFYRPGLDYLGGPGILDPVRLDQRRRQMLDDGEADPHPDPRPAIVLFDRQCRAAGAHLIVVPVPDKAAIQAARLTERLDFAQPIAPPDNPDFALLMEELRREGVDVFDPSPSQVASDDVRFLIQDTHWTPAWMETVARDLARYVESKVKLGPATAFSVQAETHNVTRVGDLVDMLNLSPKQTAYPPQTVAIRRVLETNGLPWQSRSNAEVLLLGDSFTNIYSVEAMGWGDAAGFAERISYALRRPVDRISRNDAGAYAARQMLSTALARGKNRLAGKKVVVWEFAARELTSGDWKLVDMTLGRPAPSRFLVPEKGTEKIVMGVVESVAAAPRPGTVPYKDHIIAVHLTDLEDDNGPIAGGEAIVYMWSMRNNVWTHAARYRQEQKVKVRLKPWTDVAGRLEAINRKELDNDALSLEEPCWGEEVER